MEWYLPVIWAGIIGSAVALYVILDGFDLGVAMLFPFAGSEAERDQMVASIAPFWDGNETWLVMGGAGLLVAFPAAYAIIMPALYIPVIVMLLALVFRGVAFEFRTVAVTSRGWWNFAFSFGSLVAALAQGAVLGGLIEGIRVENRAFAGGPLDWASPFALICGLGLAAGYVLLGATWLVMKTDGAVAARARRQAVVALLLVLGFMAAVSLYTPLALERIAARWFTLPNLLWLWPVPIVTVLTAWGLWRGLETGREAAPFLLTIALFLLGYLGLVISSYPYLVPPVLTIWEAAAAPSALIFMLVGTAVLLPVILAYTAYAYWVFRGKTRAGESYH
jgi:cytochrome bd ubiquinol oxidase subunit II